MGYFMTRLRPFLCRLQLLERLNPLWGHNNLAHGVAVGFMGWGLRAFRCDTIMYYSKILQCSSGVMP